MSRWTRNVDIFSKSYLIVPAHEQFVYACFPSHICADFKLACTGTWWWYSIRRAYLYPVFCQVRRSRKGNLSRTTRHNCRSGTQFFIHRLIMNCSQEPLDIDIWLVIWQPCSTPQVCFHSGFVAAKSSSWHGTPVGKSKSSPNQTRFCKCPFLRHEQQISKTALCWRSRIRVIPLIVDPMWQGVFQHSWQTRRSSSKQLSLWVCGTCCRAISLCLSDVIDHSYHKRAGQIMECGKAV